MPIPLLNLHLFGNFRFEYGDKPLTFNALPKTLPLLAYLLLNRSPIPRDVLAFTFWPDVDEAEARANLRRHLYDLRRVLPEIAGEWVTRQGQALRWNPDAPYWLDVEAFERYCREPAHMHDALALYAGDLLPEVYDDWLDFDRQRLRTLYFSTAGQLLAARRAEGLFELAIPIAEQALRQDPWREDILRDLIELRYLAGDRMGAMQAYQNFKKRMTEELGVTPMPETTQLYELVTHGDHLPGAPNSAGIHLTPGVPNPPSSRSSLPGNIPIPLKPIIGREDEITAIVNLIGQAKAVTRLLTLTGTAGTGKTRLALEVAARVVQERAHVFPDGVFFVPLASLSRADLMLPTIAAAMGVKASDSAGLVQTLANDLRYKQVLLVLDNLEHILDAVPQLGELLNVAGGLRILSTSQAVLRLYGEREYPVRPLALPDLSHLPPAERLAEYPSVILFVETARATDPRFVLDATNAADVAQICARLDGLPLAIELAAARTRIFSPSGLLDQLATRFDILTNRARNVPERHRTLRSAVEWSYNLMAEEERKLFARLSLFPGGFTAEMVGEVLLAPATAHLAMDVLEMLAEKNIIQPDIVNTEEDPRFYMLSTLRAYAWERLQLDPSLMNLYRRRAAYYARLADEASEGVLKADQARWLAWLQMDENNLRAVLDWAFRAESTQEDAEMGMQIIGNAVVRFWKMRGKMVEGQDWCRRAWEQREKLSRPLQARLAQHRATFYVWQGEYEKARIYFEEEYQFALAEGNQKARANFLQGLGLVAGHLAEYEQAEKYFLEAVEIEKALEPNEISYNHSVALNNLGIVYRHLGNYARAIEIQQGVLAYRLKEGDEWGLSSALNNIGLLENLQGQYELARGHFRESIRIRQRLGDSLGVVVSMSGLANMYARQEQHAEMVCLYSVTRKLCQQFDYKPSVEARFEETHDLDAARRKLGDAEYAQAWEIGAQMSLEQAVAYAFAL